MIAGHQRAGRVLLNDPPTQLLPPALSFHVNRRQQRHTRQVLLEKPLEELHPGQSLRPPRPTHLHARTPVGGHQG